MSNIDNFYSKAQSYIDEFFGKKDARDDAAEIALTAAEKEIIDGYNIIRLWTLDGGSGIYAVGNSSGQGIHAIGSSSGYGIYGSSGNYGYKGNKHEQQ